MTLHEPSTLLTDLILAGLAGWLGVALRRLRPALPPAVHWWSIALFATAASAAVGGLYHGFGPNFSPAVARAWWTTTLLILCATAAAMDLALLHELRGAPGHSPPASPGRRPRRDPWLAVAGFKFLAFGTVVVQHPKFVVAIIAYGLTMLAWTIAAIVLRRPWSGFLLLGVGLSLAAAVVQQTRFGLGTHFNHNDLYHLIQAFALIAFQFAGRRFSPQRPPGECG